MRRPSAGPACVRIVIAPGAVIVPLGVVRVGRLVRRDVGAPIGRVAPRRMTVRIRSCAIAAVILRISASRSQRQRGNGDNQ